MEIRIYIPKENEKGEFYRRLLIISNNEIKYNLKIGFLSYSNIDLPEELYESLVLIHNCGRAYLLNFGDISEDEELIRLIVKEVINEMAPLSDFLESPALFVFLNEDQKIDLDNLDSELKITLYYFMFFIGMKD
ncbi:hypothetical protein [Methanocaldococcus sp.]|uniref:hypothetical protein n=1 Tax=Methanocaldococcus sp. TaxID=2152917 RepID=UPI002623D468|nr:hypothetical protein [Methanocaldococcus sp.]MCQ6253577.1 hypothetical protein [Methanocaldococcus sp.]